jgi:hypothetical protein
MPKIVKNLKLARDEEGSSIFAQVPTQIYIRYCFIGKYSLFRSFDLEMFGLNKAR